MLFLTIEDETCIAIFLLWPDRFEICRCQIMSASMIAMRDGLHEEDEVIHMISDRIVDHDEMLRSIGGMDIAVAPGRDDRASGANQTERGRCDKSTTQQKWPGHLLPYLFLWPQ